MGGVLTLGFALSKLAAELEVMSCYANRHILHVQSCSQCFITDYQYIAYPSFVLLSY